MISNPINPTNISQILATVENVEMTAGADPTTLYTPPLGKQVNLTRIVFRGNTSPLGGGEAFGITSLSGDTDLSALTSLNQTFMRAIEEGDWTPVFLETIFLTPTTGSTLECYCTIDLFGYLTDAIAILYDDDTLEAAYDKLTFVMAVPIDEKTWTLPLASTLTAGWSINVKHHGSVATGNDVKPQGVDYTVVKMNVGGTDYDYMTFDNATDLTITYNGTKFVVTGTGATGANA